MKQFQMHIIIYFSLLLVIPQINYENTDRNIVNRYPTDEEIMIPAGRYQSNINMENNAQVQFTSPREEPIVEWSLTVPDLDPGSLMVDNKGYIWYSEDLKHNHSQRNITCLEPFGIKIMTIPIYGVQEVWPILICANLIIFQEKNYADSLISLRCIDSNGLTVWCSEPVKSYSFWPRAWRLSGNRFMIPVGKSNLEIFNIYSLYDGKLLNRIKFPEYDGEAWYLGPLNLPDGGWISCTDTGITKFQPNFDIAWRYNISEPFLNSRPVYSPNGMLIIGDSTKLSAVDIKSGNQIWENKDSGNYRPIGFTPKGNFIAYSENCLSAFDIKGNHLWSTRAGSYKPFPDADLLIYKDSSILFFDQENLNLISANGDIIWTLNITYLLGNHPIAISDCYLNPAPDGRIILSFKNLGEPDDTLIVSLRSQT